MADEWVESRTSPNDLGEGRGLRLAVVGAGVGGLAVAGVASSRGGDVRLYDINAERIRQINAAGRKIRLAGRFSGVAPLALATSDAREAVADTDLVVMVVPGPEQRNAALTIAPHLERGQVVLVTPGCTGGALAVREAIRAAGGPDIPVAETDVFAFGCSEPQALTSEITSVKQSIKVGILPLSELPGVLARVRRLFPFAEAAPSVLHTSLTNMNAVFHVPGMIMNAGRIEDEQQDFDFYTEGITSSVSRLITEYDSERIRVAEALRITVPSLTEWAKEAYDVNASSASEAIEYLKRDVYAGSRAPRSLNHRYLTEDVPCGAVPVASLAKAMGIPTPLHVQLVALASRLCDISFETNGRTIADLGFHRLTVEGVREHVGLPPSP